MKDKKITSNIGIIAGVIIIGIGIYVMNPETLLLGERNDVGSLVEFGGDFYTEIYAMTYSAANAVQRAYVNICNAIGWLIIALGAFDICYFATKLSEAIQQDEMEYTYSDNQPASDVPLNTESESQQIVKKSLYCPNCENKINSFPCYFCGYMLSNSTPTTECSPTRDSEWTCLSCNTKNSTNHGQCKNCGQFRA